MPSDDSPTPRTIAKTEGQRSSRDTFLGAAATILSVSTLFTMVGSILRFQEDHFSAGVDVAYGFAVLFTLVLVLAFGMAGIAFLGGSNRRASSLSVGATLAACGFLAEFIGAVILAAVYAANPLPGDTFVAGQGTESAGLLLLTVGAFTTLVAFYKAAEPGRGTVRSQRDGRLGWASISLALGLTLLMVSDLVYLAAYLDVSMLGRLSVGYGFGAGGKAVAVGAAVVAAVAFRNSRRRQAEGKPWLPQRDRLLGVATVVFAVGFLLIGVGEIVLVSSPGITGETATAGWLDAIWELGLMAGGICAAVGFFRSRHARAEPSGRLAAESPRGLRP